MPRVRIVGSGRRSLEVTLPNEISHAAATTSGATINTGLLKNQAALFPSCVSYAPLPLW